MFQVPALRPASSVVVLRRRCVPLGLTSRQLECLVWVARGKSSSDIGAILGISARTVDEHLTRACEHFGVRTRFQAVLEALDCGLIELETP